MSYKGAEAHQALPFSITSSFTNESRQCSSDTLCLIRLVGTGRERYIKASNVVEVYDKRSTIRCCSDCKLEERWTYLMARQALHPALVLALEKIDNEAIVALFVYLPLLLAGDLRR